MQLSLRTDRSLLRATARSTRYLQVTLTAPTAPPRDDSGQQARPPVHIGIVLDRSGSMHSIADDTRGGFDSFIGKEREQDGNTVVTLAPFDQ